MPHARVTYDQAAGAFREWLVDWTARCAAQSDQLSGDFGGTDSSAVAALAAHRRPLLAVTFVDGPGVWELERMHRITNSLPGLQHQMIAIDQQRLVERAVANRFPWLSDRLTPFDARTLPYSGLEDPSSLPVTDQPGASVFLIALRRAEFQLAASAGSSDHLVGGLGDLVLSQGMAAPVTLLRAGQPLRCTLAALALARRTRTSSLRVWLASLRLAGSSYERSARGAVRALRNSVPGVEPPFWPRLLDWGSLPGAASWLTPDAAQLAAQRAQQLIGRSPEYVDPERIFDWWEARRMTARLAMTTAVASSYGIQLHDPYGDLRVLELCLAIASRQREPDGALEPLVTQTLANRSRAISPAGGQKTIRDQ